MSSRSRSFIAVLVVLASVLLIPAVSVHKANAASDNGALVVNHGGGVNAPCKADVTLNGQPMVYFGYISHFVQTPSGKVNLGCQLWGPPVDHAITIGDLHIGPTGHAILSENGS